MGWGSSTHDDLVPTHLKLTDAQKCAVRGFGNMNMRHAFPTLPILRRFVQCFLVCFEICAVQYEGVRWSEWCFSICGILFKLHWQTSNFYVSLAPSTTASAWLISTGFKSHAEKSAKKQKPPSQKNPFLGPAPVTPVV